MVVERIKTMLCLTKHEFDLEAVTHELGIIPTTARRWEEFPPQSIAAGVAETEWVYEIEQKNCRSVSIVFRRLMDVFQDRQKLMQVVEKYQLKVDVVIVIQMINGDSPLILLEKEEIDFLSEIRADLGFDLYDYYEDDPDMLT